MWRGEGTQEVTNRIDGLREREVPKWLGGFELAEHSRRLDWESG